MIRIVILDKGFVAVGKVTEGEKWLTIENAFFVRRWGTTKGLGEIAEGGPTSSTVLDKTPTQRIPIHAVMNTIECDPKKWKKTLES